MHYTYILKCADGSLYTGYALDVMHRLVVHNSGKGSKYTRGRLPAELVYYSSFETKREAMQMEIQIKKLTKSQKNKLIKEGMKVQMTKYREFLEKNIDSDYREFHKKLIPGVEDFMGVRTPVIKKFAKEIANNDYSHFLQMKKFDSYEERMLYGLVIGSLKLPFDKVAVHIEEFVPYIDNWAVCDSFCASLKITKKYKTEMLALIEKYLLTKEEYQLRFAVIMLMNYYIESPYINKVFDFFVAVKHNGYYVKMAIAWAISTAFVRERAETLKLLKDNKLDDWTHNKAIQKIRESNRVSELDKKLVSDLKRVNNRE